MLVQRSSRSCRAALNGNSQVVRIGCIAPHADRFNKAPIAFIQHSPNLVTTKNNHPPSVMEQRSCCTKGERHAPFSALYCLQQHQQVRATPLRSPPAVPAGAGGRHAPPACARLPNTQGTANTPTHTSPASTAIRTARFLVLLSTLLSCTLAHIQWGYAPWGNIVTAPVCGPAVACASRRPS